MPLQAGTIRKSAHVLAKCTSAPLHCTDPWIPRIAWTVLHVSLDEALALAKGNVHGVSLIPQALNTALVEKCRRRKPMHTCLAVQFADVCMCIGLCSCFHLPRLALWQPRPAKSERITAVSCIYQTPQPSGFKLICTLNRAGPSQGNMKLGLT